MNQLDRLCINKQYGSFRPAALKKQKWESSQVITIGFKNSNLQVRQRIIEVAETWTEHANVIFEWLEDWKKCMVRIGFDKNAGSWSYVGQQCVQIQNNKTTMNFGWLSPSTLDRELVPVVLHEFGHMLGLIHEHQAPENGIKWNKPAVYKAYEAFGWSKLMVDQQVFAQVEQQLVDQTDFDPHSIMCYPIPPEFTTDGFSVGWKQVLSDRDMAFITETYP